MRFLRVQFVTLNQKRKITFALLTILLSTLNTSGQTNSRLLNFEFEGVVLNGVLNLPVEGETKGMVLIVHGSGKTDAVAQDWYADVRETLVKAGYSTYMWDKKGCGKSGGTFNYHQSVQNSAEEVIAAIQHLQQQEIMGSNQIYMKD